MANAKAAYQHLLRCFKHLPDPDESALYLLSFALGGKHVRTAQRALHTDQALTVSQASLLHTLAHRRGVLREPVPFIVGDWDFCGLKGVKVASPTLCPRPESEELVGLARDAAKPTPEGTLLDIGTGSGVLACALLKDLKLWKGVAIDISPKAVALASHNAKTTGVEGRLAVHCADVTQWSPPKGSPLFSMVVSNPPYICDTEMSTLPPEVVQWEDPVALKGRDPRGLGVILSILARVPPWMQSKASIYLETGHQHPLLLHQMLHNGRKGGEGCLTLNPASGIGAQVSLPWTPPLTQEEWDLGSSAYGAPLENLSNVWEWGGAFTDFQGLPRFVCLKLRR